MCFAPQRRALFRHLNFQKWSGPGVFCTFWLGNVLRATTACTFSTSQLPKVVREWVSKVGLAGVFCTFWLRNVLRATTACTFSTLQLPKGVRRWGVLYIFTWKYASRHKQRALFRHLNFQKWSGPGVFCTFWLGNVLRATTACTFSTSQLPKVVREWCVLYILTSKCASRHNGVHFFDIATSKRGPDAEVFCKTFSLGNMLRATTACTFSTSQLPKMGPESEVFCAFWLANVLRATTACNFSSLIWPAGSAPAALASLLFDPPEPQIIGNRKNTVFRDFPNLFGHLHLLSSYSFSSTLLSSNLSLLSASSLLCFSSVHIVGSLTSKLPSMKHCLFSLMRNMMIYLFKMAIFQKTTHFLSLHQACQGWCHAWAGWCHAWVATCHAWAACQAWVPGKVWR